MSAPDALCYSLALLVTVFAIAFLVTILAELWDTRGR